MRSFFELHRVAILAAAIAPLAFTFVAKRATPVANAAPVGAVNVAPSAANASTPFRLPWSAGTSLYLTQDANDDCCGDHVGSNKYGYDFAAWDGSSFDVIAPAAGTVVHVKMSSKHGCGDASCVNDANYVVIDHGDGTQTTMLHLEHASLDPAIRCGTFVRRGQRLARSGSTGWSTGVHLHVERDQVKKSLKQVCECGADGQACAPTVAGWKEFWPSTQQPNVPVKFQEWTAADAPNNRRGMIGPSTNVDAHEDVLTLALDGRFTATGGDWVKDAANGTGAFQYAKADGKARGRLSLKGTLAKPGVYEVWAYVPAASGVASTDTAISIETPKGTTKGTLDGGVIGGAYHPVRGLERVSLDGTDDVSVVFGSETAVEGKSIVADSIVLRRAGALNADPMLQASKSP